MARIDTSSSVVRGAVVLAAALVLQLAFLGSYVGALHEPRPHDIPVAVVGPSSVATELDRLPGRPLDATAVSSLEAGKQRVAQRRDYAVLVPVAPATSAQAEQAASVLYVASAANKPMATLLPTLFDRIAAEQRLPAPTVRDLAPLPPADSEGLSGFYAVISWMVGGYFGATLLGLVGSSRIRSPRHAAYRLGGMLAMSVASGLLSAILLQDVIGVLGEASYLSLAGIGALAVFAAGAATIAFQSVLGIAGTGVAVVLFVVLGNPSAGGIFSPQLIPGFWREIGAALPTGASTTLVRNVTYFDSTAVGGPTLVLLIWAGLGVVVTIVRGGRSVSARQAEGEAVAGVAGI